MTTTSKKTEVVHQLLAMHLRKFYGSKFTILVISSLKTISNDPLLIESCDIFTLLATKGTDIIWYIVKKEALLLNVQYNIWLMGLPSPSSIENEGMKRKGSFWGHKNIALLISQLHQWSRHEQLNVPKKSCSLYYLNLYVMFYKYIMTKPNIHFMCFSFLS